MDADQARERLAQERTRLEQVKGALDADSMGEGLADSASELARSDQHLADIGSETFEREKDVSILEEVELELADVEHALRRLDEGTYGTCEVCRQPIGDERLEALPASRFCVVHQAQAEAGPIL